MRPGKKPAHLAMAGAKLPRQSIWEAIRTLSNSDVALTTYNVSRRSGQDDEAVRDYMRALAKAGITQQLKSMGRRDAIWSLIKDEGAEAPRVNKRGERQPYDAVECIWRALRILGELNAVDAKAQAEAGGAKITENGARIYLQGLALAGYVSREGGTPGKPAVYRLLPGRYSGPLHPVYQRCNYEQVFDQNLCEVVWVKGQTPEQTDLASLRIENDRFRKLLAELKTARPLVLYGDAWIEEIKAVLGEPAEVTQ